MKFKLTESSLSRINLYAQKYDIACISATKYLPKVQDFQTQHEFEKEFADRIGKQKKLDTKALAYKLLGEFNCAIPIKGFYQYQAASDPSKENSFLTANLKQDPKFKDKCMQIAIDCKQNSFFYVPAGTYDGYWVYTGVDLSEEDWLDKNHKKGLEEYRGKVHFGSFNVSKEGTGFSLVNGRPFGAYDGNKHQIDINNINFNDTSDSDESVIVIEESYDDISFSIPSKISWHEADYLSKFHW